jgi:uncharacterized damage-inducible protein DinB
MSEPTQLTGLEPEGLIRMIESGGGAYMPLARVLSGLSDQQAHLVVQGLPHSIAEVVSHMHYWQKWLLDSIRGKAPPWPEHAETGWPTVPEGGWDELVASFLQLLEECKAIAIDEEAIAQPFSWGQERTTVGYALLVWAVQNAYHAGQIVVMRQLIGAWPPEGGTTT